MDNRKVIVSYKEGNITKYMNENQNQCLICLNNEELLIITNEYCKCYINVIICKSCFIKWIINYYNCFICRKKFITDDKYRFSIIDYQTPTSLPKNTSFFCGGIDEVSINLFNNKENNKWQIK